MPPLAVFGIDSSGLDTAVKLLLLVLVVIWLALVYYTYADARRRWRHRSTKRLAGAGRWR